MDQRELAAIAARRLRDESPQDPGLRRLVEGAETSEPRRTPIAAALWEWMWRLDPGLTPQRWAKDGPQPPEQDALNPFLNFEDLSETESVAVVAELDLSAAALLEAAVQAERVSDWWATGDVLRRYMTIHVESERFMSDLRSRTRLPSTSGRHQTLALDDELPPTQLDDYQVALTRLLLIGHPATTRQILPVLLVTHATTDDTTFLDQVRIARFAIRRVQTRARVTSARMTARVVVRPRPYGVPLREPQTVARRTQRTPVEAFANRLSAAAAVLIGTVAWTESPYEDKIEDREWQAQP